MDGLSHRIKVLSKNPSLNCILLSNNLQANSEDDVDYTLPSSALDSASLSLDDPFRDETSPFDMGQVWNVSSGYDARALADASEHEKRYVLDAMMKLALSIKGGKAQHASGGGVGGASSSISSREYLSKIPFISVPHGSITDGGYALAMGSYVLATPDSRFRISNPSRGLSLDPIGLSFILPRLGWEYAQPSAKYPATGQLLALAGYEANGYDMVECGLATHFLDSAKSVGEIERALSQLPPYDQQVLKRSPVRQYGYTESASENNRRDINAEYRNVGVANLIHSASAFDAGGLDYASAATEALFFENEDPSLVLESERANYILHKQSMLVSVAATFDDVFQKESSIEDIVERMREIASLEATDEEEVEFVNLAKELLDGMEAQSPLALHAVYQLMSVGKNKKETLESCMERERGVLLKLFEREDYKNWASSGASEGEFKEWKHKSVHEVTPDEVKELFAK